MGEIVEGERYEMECSPPPSPPLLEQGTKGGEEGGGRRNREEFIMSTPHFEILRSFDFGDEVSLCKVW